MKRLFIGLLLISLVVPQASLAAMSPSQKAGMDGLVKQLRMAGDDPVKLNKAVTAIQRNPKAMQQILSGKDQALRRLYLKQDALLRGQQITGRWKSVREANQLVDRVGKVMAGQDTAAKRRAIMDLLDNSEAVNRLNRHGDPRLRKQISKHINRYQNETKALIRQRAAARLGVDPERIVFVNTTHKSGVPKVGQDWDLTIRIVDESVDPQTGRAVRTVRDVQPHRVVDIVEESFYQATTGKVPPTEAKALKEFRKAAALHSEAKSLELTWALHKEAIGGGIREGSQLVKGKLPIRDAQQLALVSEFKIQRPVAGEVSGIIHKAHAEMQALGLKAGDPRVQEILIRAQQQAHHLQVERARTFTKMFDKHIAPRVKGYGGRVPKQLQAAAEILRQLGEDSIDVGNASRRLGELGLTIDDVVYKSAGLVDAAKTLRPPAKAQTTAVQKVGHYFRDNWRKVVDGKVSGAALRGTGHLLTGAFVAGEYSKGLQEEMDLAIARDQDLHGGYALVRAWDTGVKEPATLVGELMGKGLEKGAIAVGSRMRDLVDLNQDFMRIAAENGVLDAFGQTYVSSLQQVWERSGANRESLMNMGSHALGALGSALMNPLDTASNVGDASWRGTKYAWQNKERASLAVGEFLGVRAVGDMLYRDVETEVFNDIQMRERLRLAVAQFRRRADGLWELLADLKRKVRRGDPAKPGVTEQVDRLADQYVQAYRLLRNDYGTWWRGVYRRYGGLENEAVADTFDAIQADLERVNALPADPLSFLDAAFLNALLSTVTIHAVDAETGQAVTVGGYVQFNAAGVKKVCRGDGPQITCKGLPPGDYQVSIKFGDYAVVSRQAKIDPLKRRHYRQRVRLKAEAPMWATITVNVRDVDTKAAIPGVRIRFNSDAEESRSTLSDTGAVRINQVLSGQVSIRASAAGYQANSSRFRIDTGQQVDYAVDIYLQADPAETDQPPPEAVSDPGEDNVICQRSLGQAMINLCQRGVMQGAVCDKINESTCCRMHADDPGKVDCWTVRDGETGPAEAENDPEKAAREQERERLREKAAAEEKAKACYAKYATRVKNARAFNAKQDPTQSIGLSVLNATPACAEAYKACKDAMWKKADACWKEGNPPKVCNPRITQMQIDCAQEDVSCSAGAWKQQCGLEER